MTPESIRAISQLRQEFYTGFAKAMQVPVSITNGNSYSSNLSRASWIDSKQQLNYVCIYAHSAPDALIPERPLILRVAINQGAGTTARYGKDCQGLNQSLHFELTLLPEEILDFLPWIVSLVKSHDIGAASAVPEPPHPLDFKAAMPLNRTVWTHRAGSRVCS